MAGKPDQSYERYRTTEYLAFAQALDQKAHLTASQKAIREKQYNELVRNTICEKAARRSQSRVERAEIRSETVIDSQLETHERGEPRKYL